MRENKKLHKVIRIEFRYIFMGVIIYVINLLANCVKTQL